MYVSAEATLFAAGLAIFALISLFVRIRRRPRFLRRAIHPPPAPHPFARKKPEWVRKDVIHLGALMPGESCRNIAAAFNRRNDRKGETVGKTYVAEVLKRHAVAILRLRKKIKNRPRKQGPRALIFAMDLTFPRDDMPVLGIIDHGTRRLLALRQLRLRTTIGVLRVLLDIIEEFGRPRFLRTDNERIFTSNLMELALILLGIQHQTTDPGCPWQNGRIERLFGTFKAKLAIWWRRVGVPDDAQPDCDTFRTWYNHARPHQSLGSLTPVMAWDGVTTTKTPHFFSEWDDILTGIST